LRFCPHAAWLPIGFRIVQLNSATKSTTEPACRGVIEANQMVRPAL
jgi:hypothetical protein